MDKTETKEGRGTRLAVGFLAALAIHFALAMLLVSITTPLERISFSMVVAEAWALFVNLAYYIGVMATIIGAVLAPFLIPMWIWQMIQRVKRGRNK